MKKIKIATEIFMLAFSCFWTMAIVLAIALMPFYEYSIDWPFWFTATAYSTYYWYKVGRRIID